MAAHLFLVRSHAFWQLMSEISVPLLLFFFAAVLVLAVAIWGVWRASPRIGKLLTIFLIVVSATFIVAKSASPAGKYVSGLCRITVAGENTIFPDDWYELSGGVFYSVINGHRSRVGSYYRKNGEWILRIDRKEGPLDEEKLRFSVFGLAMIRPPGTENGGETEYHRRRIVPFTRPHWLPDWLE